MRMWRSVVAGLVLACSSPAWGAGVIEDHFTAGESVERDEGAAGGADLRPALGPQRMLAILVDFPGRPSPVTQAQVAGAYLNVIRPFYEEVSYGRVSVPVTDVVGPFLVPESCAIPLQAAFDAADATVDFRNYDYVSVWGDFNCGWGGIAFLGKVVVNTADGQVLVGTNNNDSGYGLDVTAGINVHELGHNFTVHHSGFLNCGAAALTAGRVGCSVIEYGDPYSGMGNFAFEPYRLIGYFEPPQRLLAGWLDPATEVIANPASGRYTIMAHERPEPGVVKALRFSRPGGDELWVSARSALGFDANFSARLPGTDVYAGALLTVLDSFGIGKPLLLDAEAPRPDAVKAVLLPGLTFTDPDTGVSLTTVSRTGDALTVDVVNGGTTTTSTSSSTSTSAPPTTSTSTSTSTSSTTEPPTTTSTSSTTSSTEPPSTTVTTTSTTTTTLDPRCRRHPHARRCRPSCDKNKNGEGEHAHR